MPSLDLLIHATHEAGFKVGGIGAVLDGLLSSDAYNAAVARSVLVGPFNPDNGAEMERLAGPRNNFTPLYSSLHGLDHLTGELPHTLFAIEQHYRCRLLYGRRAFGSHSHEVLLVWPWPGVAHMLDEFKAGLQRRFGVDSYRYQGQSEYDLYLAAALPAYAALQAIVSPSPTRPPDFSPAPGARGVLLAHEWLGLPLAYGAMTIQPDAYRTVFYAHEVATARLLVEGHPGHDTRFYNILREGLAQGHTLEDLFGDQGDFFKHALIRAAWGCHGVFAVGDPVVEELRFLGHGYRARRIDLVYNGVPSFTTSVEEKAASKAKLQAYAHALLGYRPDFVFSHVTRMVLSKALWRDLRVMEQLDDMLAHHGRTATLFVLSSSPPTGRPSDDAWRMESAYGWPANHRVGWPDLVDLEVDFWAAANTFNQRARASQVVLVNQFGWSRDRCGGRMPADMEWLDLRRGSDAEFGQSIYEPFGIAQVEPLSFGGLCVVSSVCGSVGFIQRAGGVDLPNVVVGDYVSLPDWARHGFATLFDIGQAERDRVEAAAAHGVATKIAQRLPVTPEQTARLITDGAALAQRMSWEVVARDYLLPSLERVTA